ncbi:hypothetical protein LG329_04565 [Virgibacillus necropolis]|uniref:hypothetical protein n=1 Tax=Virgibacillus necropolis TaxID=163877 RepID=UPI00384C67E8
MKIVLDETYGITEEIANEISIHIRPANLFKNSDDGLLNELRQEKSSLFGSDIKLRKYSIEDNIEFFSSFQGEKVIYFYDEKISDIDGLSRLSNWLLPNVMLYPIPLTMNRAQFIYEVDFLKNKMMHFPDEISFNSIKNWINDCRDTTVSWSIIPDKKPFLNKNPFIKRYKNMKSNQYLLFQGLNDNNKKPLSKGEYHTLLEGLENKLGDNSRVVVVSKNVDVEINDTYEYYNLPNYLPPNNLPYVHIVAVRNSSESIGVNVE